MLEHKLDPHHRPLRTVLVENNIIKGSFPPFTKDFNNLNFNHLDGVAPSLQAVQQSLKFRTTSIVLDHKLEHRPEVSYLVEHNILPSLTDMAEYQTDSESEGISLSQNQNIRNRLIGPIFSYIKECLLIFFVIDEKENEDRFHEAAVSLKHKLEKRPSMSQLIDTGILDFGKSLLSLSIFYLINSGWWHFWGN